MAQFDVHRNKGALRDSIPFVVIVQSAQRVVLHPLVTVSVAVDQLGERVGSLAQEGQIIADALDELLTRARG